MKTVGWISLAIIGVIIIMLYASWQIYGWVYRGTNNPEPFNKNLTFVGNDNRNYSSSKTYQNMDGSIIIASVMIKMTSPHKEIDIMKLSSTGKLLWEKTFSFARFTFWDLVPAIIRRGRDVQHLEIQGINLVDGKYYLLVNRYNGSMFEPFILTLDTSGKKLSSGKVKLELDMEAPVKSIMQNNYAYMSYLDLATKMLCFAKIDVKTANIIINPMLFYKQDSLLINTIAVDKADTTVSMTAYDSKKGCSIYMYTPTLDLKEYIRTEPTSEFTFLKYIGDKLYGVVKEDSLLRIVDLTSFVRPLIVFTDTPPYKDFRAKDLSLINGNFFVALDVDNPQATDYRRDVVIRKYTPNGEEPKEYVIQGKRTENAYKLYPLSDQNLIVIGSSSMNLNNGFRVFATKFKL